MNKFIFIPVVDEHGVPSQKLWRIKEGGTIHKKLCDANGGKFPKTTIVIPKDILT